MGGSVDVGIVSIRWHGAVRQECGLPHVSAVGRLAPLLTGQPISDILRRA